MSTSTGATELSQQTVKGPLVATIHGNAKVNMLSALHFLHRSGHSRGNQRGHGGRRVRHQVYGGPVVLPHQVNVGLVEIPRWTTAGAQPRRTHGLVPLNRHRRGAAWRTWLLSFAMQFAVVQRGEPNFKFSVLSLTLISSGTSNWMLMLSAVMAPCHVQGLLWKN